MKKLREGAFFVTSLQPGGSVLLFERIIVFLKVTWHEHMDPIDNISNYKFGIFYYNPDDPRTVVPKRVRSLGFTFNFAKPGGYAFLVFLIALVVFMSLISA